MVGAVNKFKLDYNCSLDFRKWCARTCFSLLLCCWWNSSSELRVCLLNFYWFLRYCWDYWTLQVCIHTSGYFQVPRHVFLFLFGTCAKSEILPQKLASSQSNAHCFGCSSLWKESLACCCVRSTLKETLKKTIHDAFWCLKRWCF
jgi:hypothetical protein